MIVALVVAAQGLAFLVYDRVERERIPLREPFTHERARGEILPSIALERPDGATWSSARLRGKPVLLHFWATWCTPCRTELPTLLALDRANDEVDVVAVALDRGWPAVAAYFRGTIPAQVVRDPSDTLKRTFGIRTLPETYLLDAEGVARLRFNGARDWQSDAAVETLHEYLRR